MRDATIDYANSPTPAAGQAEATFAAGCFWGPEFRFRQIPGVVDAEVGYIGGRTDRPTYKDVCHTDTGHAEAVRLIFDPAVVSYDELLAAFFEMHNPTTRDRQGPDIGSQYRSGIFTHGDEQQAAAAAFIEKLRAAGRFGSREIVTEVTPVASTSGFWRAEEYHQQYNKKTGRAACGI